MNDAAAAAAAAIDLEGDPPEVETVEPADLLPSGAAQDLAVTPERAMLLTLLDVTLGDLLDVNARIRGAAYAWFASDEIGSDDGLTFRFVAEHLDLDVCWVRARLPQLAGGLSAKRRATMRRSSKRRRPVSDPRNAGGVVIDGRGAVG